MTDLDLINTVFEFLYRNNSCDNIGLVVAEKHNAEVSNEECLRLSRIVVSTGFVKEFNWSYGPHRTMALNDSGHQMMLQYGSYISFLDSGKKEKDQTSEDANLKRKNLELEIEKKTIERKYKPWEITIAVIGGICTIIVIVEQVIRLINWIISSPIG